MTQVKFKLDPNPTFVAKVALPLHGGGSVEVGFTFRHKTADALEAFLRTVGERTVVDSLLEVVAGWELEDELSAENIQRLVQNYQGAGRAISAAYVAELSQARLGN